MEFKKKLFILDTNVLLTDPHAIFAFQENDVIIPIAVIEEIDAMKSRNDSIGFNARYTSRLLDKLREQGRLDEGVFLETGGILRIDIDRNNHHIPEGLAQDKMDNRILSVAFSAKDNLKDRYKKIILVSRDINMRIKANAFGLDAADYIKDKIEYESSYVGMLELKVSPEVINSFYAKGYVKLEGHNLHANECVHFRSGNQSALGIYKKEKDLIEKLVFQEVTPWGIRARNREQRFALELLLDDNIKIVTIVGRAGTGKTLLALAAGLYKVIDEEVYRKLLVARPVIPMGRDIGYLPGDKDEKLRPWMQPIYDNLEFLLYGEESGKKKEEAHLSVEFLEQKEFIQIEPLTYIRGRSIPHQYIIIDEAQNLTRHEIKTIITRAGKGTKIVLTGDPEQIDNPYLDENSNGLTYVADRFKDIEIAGHITLIKGERSPLAEIGARIL
ncbi:phosphate starvation-inducible protein PhoH [Anoxybacter fermentans]|uniref:Phosphate starvation-inducible protein PhoH n=1 Tax=Anoxybacter fermentans TaxID=1323375 RepID=A0A3Q9HNI7_9FIRM|nr:PhoH family protein [Anoxybacter fermentans]AZR72064.1 phosphate starvation-inducible protein PhoH [Anoxybacter fermentans]